MPTMGNLPLADVTRLYDPAILEMLRTLYMPSSFKMYMSNPALYARLTNAEWRRPPDYAQITRDVSRGN